MKTYRTQQNIGRAKYVVSFYDGVKTHPDGSAFFDLEIFKSKKKLAAFAAELNSKGYTQTN